MEKFSTAIYHKVLEYCSARRTVTAAELQFECGLDYEAAKRCLNRMNREDCVTLFPNGEVYLVNGAYCDVNDEDAAFMRIHEAARSMTNRDVGELECIIERADGKKGNWQRPFTQERANSVSDLIANGFAEITEGKIVYCLSEVEKKFFLERNSATSAERSMRSARLDAAKKKKEREQNGGNEEKEGKPADKSCADACETKEGGEKKPPITEEELREMLRKVLFSDDKYDTGERFDDDIREDDDDTSDNAVSEDDDDIGEDDDDIPYYVADEDDDDISEDDDDIPYYGVDEDDDDDGGEDDG